MIDDLKWRYRLKEMRAMLEAERHYLLSGRVADIAKLDTRREAVAAHFEELPANASENTQSELEALKVLAGRNERLLMAYLRGARSASERVVTLTEGTGRIGAYREDGSRLDCPANGRGKQHRV